MGAFARTFDSHNHPTLDLQPGADAPPIPLQHIIGRAKDGTSENEELLPRVFDLLRGLGAKEKRLQERRAMLYNGVLVLFVDTHDHYYLNKFAPDISVVLDGCCMAPFTTLALLELQVRAKQIIRI